MLYHPVKIGSLSLPGNIFLAPVAGYSDYAFRSICADCGADFAYTEMVSSEALVRGSQKTDFLMKRAPNEKSYAVQIFGGNSEVMSEATRLVLKKTSCECIDINCGCPVQKVVKTFAGSALTANPERLYKIAKSVVDTVKNYDEIRIDKDGNKIKSENVEPIPVSVKIRKGWDSNNITWKEIASAAIEAEVSAITFHGRTRAQGYEGKSAWGALKDLTDFVGKKIPVFGSGDVFSPQDAAKMLETTNCDAVMLARGAIGNPFLFTEIREYLTTGKITEITSEERIKTGFRELDFLVQEYGEKKACLEMRKRFCLYSKGFSGGAILRKSIVNASTVSDYKKIFERFFHL